MTVTLNRPDELNAFDVEMIRASLDLYEAVDADDAVRVVSFLEKCPARFTLNVSSDLPAFFPCWDEPSYED
jgi:hypothetical protein